MEPPNIGNEINKAMARYINHLDVKNTEFPIEITYVWRIKSDQFQGTMMPGIVLEPEGNWSAFESYRINRVELMALKETLYQEGFISEF